MPTNRQHPLVVEAVEAFREKFKDWHVVSIDVQKFSEFQVYDDVEDFLISKMTHAIEVASHEKSMVDISLAFEAGRKYATHEAMEVVEESIRDLHVAISETDGHPMQEYYIARFKEAKFIREALSRLLK